LPAASAIPTSTAALSQDGVAGRLNAQALEAATHHRPRLDGKTRKIQDPESLPNDGYRLLDDLRDKIGGLLLLTATPMQLHDFELYSMIELVEPGLFGTYSDFVESRGEIASIKRAVTVLRSPTPRDAEKDVMLEVHRLDEAPVELHGVSV